ncbi:MAG: hypothetical protein Q4C58_07865 [Eubacteriales bacterium]|nr:hypothetical protein [Eubacteriales bacterium]
MKTKGIVIGFCVIDIVLIAVCIFLLARQDRTVPVISFSEEPVIYSESMNEDQLLEGVTATDDADGDVSDTLVIEKIAETSDGKVIVTYAALDSSNNVAKVSRILPVEEKQEISVSNTDIPQEESQAETTREEANGENPNQEEDPNVPEADANGENNDENNDGNNDDQANGTPREAQEPPVVQQPEEVAVGANDNPDEGVRENQAPIMQLSTNVLPVAAGSTAVDWNSCIGTLSDDTDSRDQLFSNIVMEGNVDLATPGDYPVVLYTRDSEGTESERNTLLVHVE